jgi:hypothetical protein
VKWAALIVILLVIALIFGMVRRLQAGAAGGAREGDVDVTEQPVPSVGAPAAAAEESADEVPVTPVSERPPTVAADDHPSQKPDDGWWPDGEDRREPTA